MTMQELAQLFVDRTTKNGEDLPLALKGIGTILFHGARSTDVNLRIDHVENAKSIIFMLMSHPNLTEGQKKHIHGLLDQLGVFHQQLLDERSETVIIPALKAASKGMA